MAKAKMTAKPVKPTKPSADFPLFPHATGRWAKKIHGDLHFFGPWDDPDVALAKYLREKDRLEAGKTPPSEEKSPLTMGELCSQFLSSKKELVARGEITKGVLLECQRACDRLLGIIGKPKIVETLKPKDFERIHAKLTKDKAGNSVAISTLANRIRVAKILFKYASDQGLIESPVNYGQSFQQPDYRMLEADRRSKPARVFTADEIRLMIEVTDIPLKALILLGINAGFGNSDCSTVPLSAVDLEGGWIEFPRSNVERRCPLWPETVDALRETMVNRPRRINEGYDHLLFVTKFGNSYIRIGEKGDNLDALSTLFLKFLNLMNLNGNRRAFYSLRRTFEMIGKETGDQLAVDAILGNAPTVDGVGDAGDQPMNDDRLKAVSDHVREWLWPTPGKRKLAKKKSTAS